jgi:hypothetical protein
MQAIQGQSPISLFGIEPRKQIAAFPFSVPTTVESGLNLFEKAIVQIGRVDQKLEEIMPNFAVQNSLDALGQMIESLFTPLESFNVWLDSNVTGSWCKQLLLFVAKLPFQVARNIIRLLYAIVKTAISAVVHPLKAVTKLSRYLVLLTEQLTRPEVWSKMGVGIVGTSCGQILMTGNPLALIGVAIGGAFTLGGLTVGAIRDEKPSQYLLGQAKGFPQALLTGFCLGLMFGAIQKASVQEPLPKPQVIVTINNADDLFKYVTKVTSSFTEPLTPEQLKEMADAMLPPSSSPGFVSMANNLKG